MASPHSCQKHVSRKYTPVRYQPTRTKVPIYGILAVQHTGMLTRSIPDMALGV